MNGTFGPVEFSVPIAATFQLIIARRNWIKVIRSTVGSLSQFTDGIKSLCSLLSSSLAY